MFAQGAFSFGSKYASCVSDCPGRYIVFGYTITTGSFKRDGNPWGVGYSGAGLNEADGRNNPSMVNIPNVGPLPPGDYRVMPSRNSKTLGPLVFDLVPLPGTNTFDRSLFRIHGNSKDNNASHGCIILDHNLRLELDKFLKQPPPSNDDYNVLRVVAS